MYALSAVLFAAFDTHAWSVKRLIRWADTQIETTSTPASWLLDLSLSATSEHVETAIHNALRANNVVLPEEIVDLLVGLICLRFKRGEISESQLFVEVADVVDSYEGGSIAAEIWCAGTDRGKEMSPELMAELDRLAKDGEKELMRLTKLDLDDDDTRAFLGA